MTKVKKIVSSTVEALFLVLAVAIGGLLAAATFIWYFIPKWKREEAKETAAKVAGIKDTIRRANEARAAKVDQQITMVKDQAEAEKAQDTVDLANSLIASAGDK